MWLQSEVPDEPYVVLIQELARDAQDYYDRLGITADGEDIMADVLRALSDERGSQVSDEEVKKIQEILYPEY